MENFEKSELKKEGRFKYVSNNPHVKFAEIIIFDYLGKKVYQPCVISTNKHYIVNKVGYFTLDDAKKVIDSYSDDKIKK